MSGGDALREGTGSDPKQKSALYTTDAAANDKATETLASVRAMSPTPRLLRFFGRPKGQEDLLHYEKPGRNIQGARYLI